VLICPADNREPAATFAALLGANVSYFASLDATPMHPYAIVSGDRNLVVDGLPVAPGTFLMTTGSCVSWTKDLHSSKETNVCGNILLANGGAQSFWGSLNVAVQRQALPTNRLAMPSGLPK
jgi:hypothetical protein